MKATPRIYTLHEDGEESSFDVSDEDTYEDEIQSDDEMPVLDDSNLVTKRRTNRKMLYSQWLGDAHDGLNPELINKCFKKTGTCLDMNGKENDKVHIDQIQTFKVPKKGDPKMEPLTAEEIEAWEKREISHRTAKVMATFD